MESAEYERLRRKAAPAAAPELSEEQVEEAWKGCHFFERRGLTLFTERLNALLRASQAGSQVKDSEEVWRKLLWSNHARYLPFEHTPYGDDGEMQCCGIDFKRLPAKEIERLLIERSLQHIQRTKAAEQAGSKVAEGGE